jgi:hypothetical protein
MDFKVGDKVKCVDPDFQHIWTPGKVYRIAFIIKNRLEMLERPGLSWEYGAFKKVLTRNLPDWF